MRAATPDGLGPHAAIVTSSKAEAYETAMAYIRPAGTVVAVGLPSREATIAANVVMTVLQKKRLIGSMVGTRLDVIEALRIAAEGHVKSAIQVRPFAELQNTFTEMIKGTLPGRVVLDCECSKDWSLSLADEQCPSKRMGSENGAPDAGWGRDSRGPHAQMMRVRKKAAEFV
jgi:hypothetical protein